VTDENISIEEVNEQIKEELVNWDKLHVSPKNIEVDPFLLDAFINALVLHLSDKGIIEDEEFTLAFKKHLLNNLKNARENFVEPAVKEMNRRKIVDGLPRMDIPREH
jgi:hypothetical protein